MSAVLNQRETTHYERSVDVHISHLRHKLDATRDSMIRYRFAAWDTSSAPNEVARAFLVPADLPHLLRDAVRRAHSAFWSFHSTSASGSRPGTSNESSSSSSRSPNRFHDEHGPQALAAFLHEQDAAFNSPAFLRGWTGTRRPVWRGLHRIDRAQKNGRMDETHLLVPSRTTRRHSSHQARPGGHLRAVTINPSMVELESPVSLLPVPC